MNAIKEKELKFNDVYENYELQIKKFQEELKLSRDKYDKYTLVNHSPLAYLPRHFQFKALRPEPAS